LDNLILRGIQERNLGEFIDYVGMVEPGACFTGGVDVVLADGYKGNLFLKAAEASSKFLCTLAKREIADLGLVDKLLLAPGKATLVRMKKNIMSIADPDKYAGAVILGYDGVIIKGHGASNTNSIYHGLCRLADCGSNNSGKELVGVVKKYSVE